MADDIDIEEHDVLDDPRIKDIFPELTKIKTEVLDIDERDNLQYESPDPTSHSSQEESPDIRPRGNRIILGSKPSGSSPNVTLENPLCFGYQRDIKQEPAYDDDQLTEEQLGTEDKYPQIEDISSVIMLGSRLPHHDELNGIQLPNDENNDLNPDDHNDKDLNNDNDNDLNNDNDYLDIPDSMVYLEDWGPRLERSFCYCNECKILFPTRNCIDAHNSTVHSFLVAVEVNKAFKSTSKPPTINTSNTPAKSTARKSTGVTESTSSSRFCYHCDKLFDSNTELIKHLYEKLTFGKLKCELCDATFEDTVQLKSHTETHTDITDDLFYRCDICSYYNKYKKIYERHMWENHKSKKDNCVKRKYDAKCPMCVQTLDSSHNYNRHIKEMHTAMFYKKIANVDNNIPSTSKLQVHPCHLCKLSYSNAFDLKTHMQSKHSNFGLKNQPKAINGSESEIPSTVTNINPTSVTIKHLIPKNSLFKCQKCNVHFTVANLALAHTKICKNITGDWTCKFCNIQFNLSDKDFHNEQHKLGDAFRIHPIDDDLYKIILCKCPDCNSYLDEFSFWQHSKVACDKNMTICNICDWPINDKCFKQHQKVHQQFNISNEFVRVTYKKILVSKRKRRPDFIFYYCETCNCVVRGPKHVSYHRQKSCLDEKHASKTYICKICGLMVRSRRHDNFHNTFPNLKIFDMKFVRISDNMSILPPIPTYPKCPKCNVCFLSKMALNKHDCADNFRTCITCREKFSDLAYKLHMPFHGRQHPPASKSARQYPLASKSARQYPPATKNAKQYPQTSENTDIKKAVMPKLIEKYKTIANTWNFLYLCKICDIMTDSYDKVVEHCQNHYNSLESYDVIIKKCDVCDFKFDLPCYEKHKNKHLTNKSLNHQSFKVFEYDFNKFFNNDSWLELFEDLPSTDIEKITSNSIYRYVRTLKMKIFSSGAAEYTVYKCEKCKRFVNPPMAILHYHNCQGNPIATGHRCFQCNGIYSSAAGLKFHTEQHTNFDGLQMRIVTFNSHEDGEFNMTLNQSGKTQSKYDKRSIKKVLTRKGKTFLYYKCLKCRCCSRDSSLEKHICKLGKYRKQCPKCKLFFSSNLHTHIQRHINFPNFRCKVVPLKMNVIEPLDTKKKLYKCKCDLHFITQKSLDEHLKNCDADNPLSSEICSKCSLRFPTNILVNHLLLHHANNKCTEFTVETIAADGILHKCGKCNVHFTSEVVLKSHYDANHFMDFEVASCITCSLHFPLADIKEHEDTYHKKGGYIKVSIFKPDEFVFEKTELVYMALFRKDLVKLDCYNSELFKCPKCKVHFLTYSRFYSHVTNNLLQTKSANCDLCGLLFSKHVLPVHKYIHHEKFGLNAEDFDIKVMVLKSYLKKKPMICRYKHPNVDNDDDIKIEKHVTSDEENAEMSHKDTEEPTDKIEVYKNYTKYIYKCDMCLVHLLTPISLNKHKIFCGTLKLKTCNFCKLKFCEKSLRKHVEIHHEKMKLRKKDLIVNNIYGLKETTGHNISNLNDTIVSNISGSNDSVNGTPVTPNKYKFSRHCNKYVFKCVECSVRFLSESNCMQHMNSGNHEDTFKHCTICNAKYHSKTYGKHVLQHHHTLQLKAEDIYVITCYKRVDSFITDGLFKCHRCKVCFMRENSFHKHLFLGCRRDLSRRESCDICNLYFSPKLAETHKENQHEYLKLTPDQIVLIEDTNVVALKNTIARTKIAKTKTVAKTIVSKTIAKMTTASLQKINEISKTLFKCNTCNLCFMKANTLQLHFDTNHKQGIIKQCEKCHYRFIRHIYSNHKHYQHKIAKLSRKDIKVLGFVEETFKSFYNPSVIKRRSPDDFIITEKTKSKLRESHESCVYKCKSCSLHFINKVSIEKHLRICKSYIPHRGKCDECNIDFTRHSLARHEYIHHEYLGLKEVEVHTIGEPKDLSNIVGSGRNGKLNESVDKHKSNISVVSMDETEDSIIINSDDESMEDVSNTPKSHSANKIRKCKLYRCSKCNLCFLKSKTLEVHVYANHPSSSKVSCSICYNNFTYQTLVKHTQLHHTIGKFTNANIIIINDNKPDDSNVPKTASKVLNKVAPTKKYFKKSTKGMKRTHYKLTESGKEMLRQSAKNTVYKCKQCDITLLSKSSGKKHDCKKNLQNEQICDICKLKFTVVSYTKHYYLHHEYLGLSKDDLKVIIVDKSNVANETDDIDTDKESSIASDLETPRKRRLNDNDQVSVKSDDTTASTEKKRKVNKDITTLFKCSECKVYYMSRATCLKHVNRHTKLDEIEFIECKVCNLAFPIMTLLKHVQIHHKSEFKLEDVLIEEYTPRPDNKQPVPEIYFAVDKLQSKLVSTTTDRDECIEIGESSGIKADRSKMSVDGDDNDSSNVRIPDLISFEDN